MKRCVLVFIVLIFSGCYIDKNIPIDYDINDSTILAIENAVEPVTENSEIDISWKYLQEIKNDFSIYEITDLDSDIYATAKTLWNIYMQESEFATEGVIDSAVDLVKCKINEEYIYILRAVCEFRKYNVIYSNQIISDFETFLFSPYSFYKQDDCFVFQYYDGGLSGGIAQRENFYRYNITTGEEETVVFRWEKAGDDSIDGVTLPQYYSDVENYKNTLTVFSDDEMQIIELYPNDFLSLESLEAALAGFVE